MYNKKLQYDSSKFKKKIREIFEKYQQDYNIKKDCRE